MWRIGELLAAEAPANDSLVVVIGGIVVAAIGALGLVLTEVVKGRPGRTTPAPPDSDTPSRLAVLEDWRVQVMKVDDLHDRTVYRVSGDVEDIVRWLNREFPNWRP